MYIYMYICHGSIKEGLLLRSSGHRLMVDYSVKHDITELQAYSIEVEAVMVKTGAGKLNIKPNFTNDAREDEINDNMKFAIMDVAAWTSTAS